MRITRLLRPCSHVLRPLGVQRVFLSPACLLRWSFQVFQVHLAAGLLLLSPRWAALPLGVTEGTCTRHLLPPAPSSTHVTSAGLCFAATGDFSGVAGCSALGAGVPCLSWGQAAGCGGRRCSRLRVRLTSCHQAGAASHTSACASPSGTQPDAALRADSAPRLAESAVGRESVPCACMCTCARPRTWEMGTRTRKGRGRARAALRPHRRGQSGQGCPQCAAVAEGRCLSLRAVSWLGWPGAGALGDQERRSDGDRCHRCVGGADEAAPRTRAGDRARCRKPTEEKAAWERNDFFLLKIKWWSLCTRSSRGRDAETSP